MQDPFPPDSEIRLAINFAANSVLDKLENFSPQGLTDFQIIEGLFDIFSNFNGQGIDDIFGGPEVDDSIVERLQNGESMADILVGDIEQEDEDMESIQAKIFIPHFKAFHSMFLILEKLNVHLPHEGMSEDLIQKMQATKYLYDGVGIDVNELIKSMQIRGQGKYIEQNRLGVFGYILFQTGEYIEAHRQFLLEANQKYFTGIIPDDTLSQLLIDFEKHIKSLLRQVVRKFPKES